MMRAISLAFTALSLTLAPLAEAFIVSGVSRLSSQSRVTVTSSSWRGGRSNEAAYPATPFDSPSGVAFARLRYPEVSPKRRPSERRMTRMSADAGEGGSEGVEAEPPTTRKPAEPVGSAGAIQDDMLVELVGQDYGMMALLRNDKFKSLIVYLRNIPPNEWVTEVQKMYPDDDEVKGMLGKVGKLMHMMDYYEAKKKK